MLERYEDLYRNALADVKVRGPERSGGADPRALICITLHKRLLSSIAAFHRTLNAHATAAEAAFEKGPAQQPMPVAPPSAPAAEDDPEDRPEGERDKQEDGWVASATVAPHAEALELLRKMRALSQRHREDADGRLKEGQVLGADSWRLSERPPWSWAPRRPRTAKTRTGGSTAQTERFGAGGGGDLRARPGPPTGIRIVPPAVYNGSIALLLPSREPRTGPVLGNGHRSDPSR